jgi:uncharacterized protein YyaL (SSP411 family)
MSLARLIVLLVLLSGLAPPVELWAEAGHGSAQYTNHLAGQLSPYLLLHTHNPVDWYPWGPEALERARREDKPIFLSIGYSTCYWCHVMERKVFSDPEIAALMNRWFVNIKVDREERPDLDKVYMNATQLMTQRGGWPNSVFLTPELKPFFAGTYFPPVDGYGRPGFPRVLEGLNQAWAERREEVLQAADQLTEAIRELEAGQRALPMPPDTVLVNRTLSSIKGRYDATYGGFGGAPKFPPCMRLEFLLDAWEQTGDEQALDIVHHTLEAMALGGIYDHIGGGFHRYATDAYWRVPHFEKMLYNQAHLAQIYLRAYHLTGEELWRRVATDILAFVEREMTGPDGAFYSALDAETDAVEGKYYLWTETEIEAVLGEEADTFWAVYKLAPVEETEGNALYLATVPAQAAQALGLAPAVLETKMDQWRAQLYPVRRQRHYPLVDDKILSAWNGLMIAAYADAFAVLQDSSYYRQAARAATFVLEHLHSADGGLKRVYRQGAVQYEGYLEDYAYLIYGLLHLHQASGEALWLEHGRVLADQMIERFWDAEGKGFFFSMGGADLLVRSKTAHDSALPAANAIAAESLMRLAEQLGVSEYHDRGIETLEAFGGMMQASPSGFTRMVYTAARYLVKEERRLAVDVSRGVATRAAIVPALQSPLKVPIKDWPGPVQIYSEMGSKQLVPDQKAQLKVYLDIEPGWHLNANPPSADLLIPTSLTLNADVQIKQVEIRYPTGETLYMPALEESLDVYQGRLTLEADWYLDTAASPGQGGDLRLLVQYQACDDRRCLPPAEWLGSLPIEVVASDSNKDELPR